MKKLITIIAVALCIAGVNAQKGAFYLGTSGIAPFALVEGGEAASPMTGFASFKPEGADEATTMFGLAPEVGYFVSDNFAVGLGVFFTSAKDALGDKLTTFGANPYGRYYFLNKGAFRMYGQLDVAFASAKADVEGAEAVTSFGVGVSPGISYNLSEKFAINATFGELGYTSVKDQYSAFALDVNMSSLQFGFTVSF